MEMLISLTPLGEKILPLMAISLAICIVLKIISILIKCIEKTNKKRDA